MDAPDCIALDSTLSPSGDPIAVAGFSFGLRLAFNFQDVREAISHAARAKSSSLEQAALLVAFQRFSGNAPAASEPAARDEHRFFNFRDNWVHMTLTSASYPQTRYSIVSGS